MTSPELRQIPILCPRLLLLSSGCIAVNRPSICAKAEASLTPGPYQPSPLGTNTTNAVNAPATANTKPARPSALLPTNSANKTRMATTAIAVPPKGPRLSVNTVPSN